MARSISRTEKMSRGRPRTNPTSIHVTLLPQVLGDLDIWIAAQEPQPSRPEAIRRLVEIALSSRSGAAQPAAEAEKQNG
jgi:hypothetical protein